MARHETPPRVADAPPLPARGRARLEDLRTLDEFALTEMLLAESALDPGQSAAIAKTARRIVERARKDKDAGDAVSAFLREYDLSSEEGVILMCLAESLLRIPDTATIDKLIGDKVGGGDWAAHLGRSPSFFVNASTFGLMLTGRLVEIEAGTRRDPGAALSRLAARVGEPIVRQAVTNAVRFLGGQFILGQTIEEAVGRAKKLAKDGHLFSFDMLGEGARTLDDALAYERSYRAALGAVARAVPKGSDIFSAPSLSIKLSALHPRFAFAQRARVMNELLPRVTELCEAAAKCGLAITIDAEEADRLELTLDLFEALARAPSLSGWNGLGLAVQAYQTRATAVIESVSDIARETGRRIPLRLVKGAYWDAEIKRAEQRGLPTYPVLTRKAATDVSYLACAKALLAEPDRFHPQFATHNAHTLAAVLSLSNGARSAELQRLHGMGETVYAAARALGLLDRPVRIYAPVGDHERLLAYLVRRLLENGANSSFIHQLEDARVPASRVTEDPAHVLQRTSPRIHPRLATPRGVFLPERLSGQGFALDSAQAASALLGAVDRAVSRPFEGRPLVGGASVDGSPPRKIADPANTARIIGTLADATAPALERALELARRAAPAWSERGGDARAALLERAADLYEAHAPELIGLCVREAGKTLPNAIDDVREAVDFLRYYAARARREFTDPLGLPGTVAERNTLGFSGRGVFACISPWNFPVAIFTGQIAAALAAGNAVVAKPAEQTSLTALAAGRLLLEAGIPPEILHILPGPGEFVGQALIRDPRIAGVAFTGSTDTARAINGTLANRPGPIIPFIAETGGLNAMIADSSALPEHIVDDALTGAFDSAGQRCSATRVLFLQSDIAARTIAMLAGAMRELRIGDPMNLATDVGPVIDEAARNALNLHAGRMTAEARLIAQCELGDDARQGIFFAPRAFELKTMDTLKHETFGPILHVVRFEGGRLDDVVDSVNASGFGLTLGLHTRLDSVVDAVRRRARVGNLYVNRNQIGAVVGAQPFGGEGLSGTGPKAGGPHYLHRFALERTQCVDTSLMGGAAELYALDQPAQSKS